ncbi:MAG TPA: ATP-binding cassette domain-containing protein, partial [Rhodocyclaceae bacterium]|nr:ATP-binding cassette domain-containing protein [Rhodocyclaceae bacterium]
MTGGVLLEARGVGKHFGGVKALDEVSLTIREGEIYGLIGPNGAGKTTFFNCLTGLYVPDSGGFAFAGAVLAANAPQRAAERGIARPFQNIRLFADMSARENVMVGRHVRTRAGVFGALLRTRSTREEEAAKQDYLHAVSAHSQLQSAHVEALAELENYQHALAAKREGNSSRNDQVLFLNALQYQREYCTRLGERLAAAERELEAKRDALMVAKRR